MRQKILFILALFTSIVLACSREEDTVMTPVISGFVPLSGAIGQIIVISGNNFAANPSSNRVEFNGVTALVSEATSTQLTVRVPPEALTGRIRVIVNGSSVTSSEDFTVTDVPDSLITDCSSAGSTVARIVCAVEAFKATLSDAQIATLQLPYTPINAARWSNLPCGSGCRNGLPIGSLNSVQRAHARAVIAAATGSAPNQGYDEILQIIDADDVLGANRGGNFSANNYLIAFLGTPAMSGTWQLQFGGHHLAINTTFTDGELVSATPVFTGIDPDSWTKDEITYAPLSDERSAMVAMLASFNASQLSGARLNTSFSNVMVGPGQDGRFPPIKQGLAISNLTSEQKALVLATIRAWVQDTEDAMAERLMRIYERELDNTYIAYAGNVNLSATGDYARIDGPSVWIEFSCQSRIHYHSVWRDHITDYGASFNF